MNEAMTQILNAATPILCLLITAGGAYLVALLKRQTAQIINVSSSMNFLDVSIIEIFFIISSTAYPSLSIVLYFGSNTKLILTILPYF